MFPPVHPAVGYLCYAAVVRARGSHPTGVGTLALLFGATLPDLVDQPLYHLAGAIPTTRAVGHSLVFGVPMLLALAVISRTRGRPELGAAFAVGYLSHLAADALWPLVVGAREELGFLLWPLTRSPEYEGQKTLASVAGVEVTTLPFELALLVAGVALWWSDGRPGFGAVRERP